MKGLRSWMPALGAAGLAALAVCAGCAPGSPREAAPPRALPFEYSGCESVRRGPVCALGGERRLRLWIAAPPGDDVLIDGRPPRAAPVALAGGLLFAVETAPGAGEVVVETRRGERRRAARLAIEENRPPQWFSDAWALGAAGDLAGARRTVEPLLASRVAAERGLALAVAAQVDLATGKPGLAEGELRQAIADHRASGLLSREIQDAATLAHRLIQRRELAAARALVAGLSGHAGHADSAFYLAYTEGLLASKTGDLRTSLRRLRAAVDHARRAGAVRHEVAATQVLGLELQRAGRDGEAAAAFAAAESSAGAGLPTCERAQLRNNRAWALLLAREARTPADDPRPLLAGALRVFDHECDAFPGGVAERVNVRVSLALAHLQAGEPEAARRRLDEARRLDPRPEPKIELWWEDLEARTLLAAGAAEGARGAFQRLAGRAREARSPEAEWRALYGEGQAREALADATGALAAYAAADAVLERESLLVPFHEGRDTFLSQRRRATRRHLDLLLRAGRPNEALALVRRARSRSVRGLRIALRLAGLAPAERAAWDRAIAAHAGAREALERAAAERWRLPSGEARRAVEEEARRLAGLRSDLDLLLARLETHGARPETPAAPPPAGAGVPPRLLPGEVLLAYHPRGEGWVGFAADERGTVARRLGSLDVARRRPEALADRLLRPFAGPIRRARGVRVLPVGELHAVDFHALPFDGGPLLAAKPVVYGLDLARAPAPPDGGARRALVVGDPTGNLPAARREAQGVAAALASAGGWTPELLLGEETRGAAVRRALPGAGLFHYAGHAIAAGWDSALPLAAGGGLTVADVLALDRAPAWVVLSGCETGAAPELAAVESMGLAQAFVSAGAEAVVAAVRPLSDRDAAAVVDRFYAELGRTGSPAEALRRAQLGARARGEGGDWAGFRVFVP